MPAIGMHARMEAMRHLRGASWFTSTNDTQGVDEETGLVVTADATGWVVDVEVPLSAPLLSTASGLMEAVRRALGAAAAGHLFDNARTRVLSESARERAADLLAGRTTLTAPRVDPSPSISLPQHVVHPTSFVADERWGRRWTGSSREDELRVFMSLTRGFEELTVTPGFLDTADPALLRHALREAFEEAARGYESQQEVSTR